MTRDAGRHRTTLSHGWLKLSRRELDEARSEPFRPVLTHRASRSISPGEVVPVEIEILPAATRLRRGEGLRLDVRWFHATNPGEPITGRGRG